MTDITHDPIYNTVPRGDFAAMIEVDRYGERSNAFDGIISATVDHFWDPNDPAFLSLADRARERVHTLHALEHLARGAGRILAVGEPLRDHARSGRAGVRREPGA